jgi:hypothetical protein
VKALPNARFLTVRRPLGEVRQSLAKFGLEADAELARRDEMLDEIETEGFAERVDFADLRQRGCRKWVWGYLLPEFPFSRERDEVYARTNIQVDMKARIVQLGWRASAVAALKEELFRATG